MMEVTILIVEKHDISIVIHNLGDSPIVNIFARQILCASGAFRTFEVQNHKTK